MFKKFKNLSVKERNTAIKVVVVVVTAISLFTFSKLGLVDMSHFLGNYRGIHIENCIDTDDCVNIDSDILLTQVEC